MKISSKSILSPGRPRDQPITLSTSQSRRLRTNGSIKGAQSPMFPNVAAAGAGGGKKRGSAFENPEPSSPKVTCIGQVRVKTKKKQARKMRTLSHRRSAGNDAGEVSFRQVGTATDSRQRNSNQRWVHLPLTICEALRGIGADFNCLFPCRSSSSSSSSSSCFSGGERNPKTSSSCGAVFERWFVTIEGGKGGGREIELVVGGGEEEEETENRRRHPLERFIEEDEARVSICIPPKNALLLMRCRSDPVKMEALSTRLLENPLPKEEEEEETAENGVSVEEDAETGEEKGEIMKISDEMNEEEDEDYSSEADAELEKLLESDKEEDDERRKSHDLSLSLLFSDVDDDEKTEDPFKEVAEAPATSTEEMETSTHETSPEEEDEDQRLELSEEEKEIPTPTGEPEEMKKPEQEISGEAEEMKKPESGLPDCLLLMMCEPKLSMEVSKETWVCSTDFIRSIPDHRRRPVAGTEHKKRVIRNIPPLPPLLPQAPVMVPPPPNGSAAVIQPPRSSCTLPATAAMSMAAMIEQKLINAVGYEPFVLTRCKSEPMRTAAAKLAPESCFWKNRKLEPLRRATLGVGAAGIGF